LEFLRFEPGHFDPLATQTSGDNMNVKSLLGSLLVAASAFSPALAQT
jgi:hypothetical protein